MSYFDTPQALCRFAIATCDITPPVGIYHRMWGAATHDRSEGVHRPLRASVAWIEPTEAPTSSGARASNEVQANALDTTPLILVALDHCLFGPPELNLVLDEAAAICGEPRENLVIIFSHTHGAGLMMLDRVSLPGGDLIPGYLREIGRKVGELVRQAREARVSATIVWGEGHCGLAAHRDLWDEERGEYVCGFNPGEVGDGTLVVGRVTAVDSGATLATIANYACHPTTLSWDNRLISPDYVGAFRETVEAETDAPCLFIQGASGELGPVEGFTGDVTVADRNGRQLAYAALAALTALPPTATRYQYEGAVISGATIGVWRHEPADDERRTRLALFRHQRWTHGLVYRPELPTRESVATDRVKWEADERAALAAGDTVRARDCRAMIERQTRMAARLEQLPAGEQYPLRIDVWRLGDAVVVAVPGEHYSLLQTRLRARFAGHPVIVATLAHGWGPSYLPTAAAYGKGIYQETIAIVVPGSLERVIDDIIRRVAPWVDHD